MSNINYILFIIHTKQSIQFMQLQSYASLARLMDAEHVYFYWPCFNDH